MKNDIYILVGYLNLFNLIPDFVYPVYTHYGQYYFADGDAYYIRNFIKIKRSVEQDIEFFNYSVRFIRTVNSTQIYIYQLRNGKLIIGTGEQVYERLISVSPIQLKMRSDLRGFFSDFSGERNQIQGASCIKLPKLPIPAQQSEHKTYTLFQKYNTSAKGDSGEIGNVYNFLLDVTVPISRNAKYYGTGRRKKSVARVYLLPGTGKITINKKGIDEYFALETMKVVVYQPLVATQTLNKFDVIVNVRGGGFAGQAGAIRHGIARALLEANPAFRPILKSAGFLTRDSRMKERKKYGLKAARRAPQFSKR